MNTKNLISKTIASIDIFKELVHRLRVEKIEKLKEAADAN
jgi:hypothetical protein